MFLTIQSEFNGPYAIYYQETNKDTHHIRTRLYFLCYLYILTMVDHKILCVCEWIMDGQTMDCFKYFTIIIIIYVWLFSFCCCFLGTFLKTSALFQNPHTHNSLREMIKLQLQCNFQSLTRWLWAEMWGWMYWVQEKRFSAHGQGSRAEENPHSHTDNYSCAW